MNGYRVELSMDDLFSLDRVLGKYSEEKRAKLVFAIARNISAILPPLKDFQKVTAPTEAMREFEREKEKLLNKHALKDDKGRPVRHPVSGQPGAWNYELKDDEKYEAALAKLKKEHKQAEDDLAEIAEKRQQLLEEKVEVEVYRIPLSRILPSEFEDEEGNENECPIAAADLSLLMRTGIVYDDAEKNEKVTPIKKGKKSKRT
jgi:hypothetical protein